MASTRASRLEANLANRTQTDFQFDMEKMNLESEPEERKVHEYFLPETYPPSVKSLSQLKPVCISDLEPGKRASGAVLYLKITGDAMRSNGAVQTLVEDQDGALQRLVVYNISPMLKPDDVLPSDTLLAIKEPNMTQTLMLRIDHPTDIVQLNLSQLKLVPEPLTKGIQGLDKTVEQYKQEGNAAFAAQNWRKAEAAYTQAISTFSADEVSEVKSDLLRNRALASIYLKRYRKAQRDALAAVRDSQENETAATAATNIKSYERAGEAAMKVQDYLQATKHYEAALKLDASSSPSTLAMSKIKDRLQEQSRGRYDFEKMSASTTKRRNRLDHASFFSNTEIRDAGSHGRGLFATRNIETGDLVMCEKALCVVFDSDRISNKYKILNSSEKRQTSIEHSRRRRVAGHTHRWKWWRTVLLGRHIVL